MKRILLATTLWLGALGAAFGQCVAVGGINTVPQPGVNCLSEPTIDTYVAVGVGIVPAASATDIACITGSATKTIRVQGIRVSGTAGTAITVPVRVMKHTVANTGGTAATGGALPAPLRMDTNGIAATATTTAYTANPTIDATAAQLDVANIHLPTTAAGVSIPATLFDWATRNFAMAPVLRGVAQQLCVNLNATSPTSGLVNVTFYWTEASQ